MIDEHLRESIEDLSNTLSEIYQASVRRTSDEYSISLGSRKAGIDQHPIPTLPLDTCAAVVPDRIHNRRSCGRAFVSTPLG